MNNLFPNLANTIRTTQNRAAYENMTGQHQFSGQQPINWFQAEQQFQGFNPPQVVVGPQQQGGSEGDQATPEGLNRLALTHVDKNGIRQWGNQFMKPIGGYAAAFNQNNPETAPGYQQHMKQQNQRYLPRVANPSLGHY